MSTSLVITRAAVHCDGRPVARLLWSGRCLKVENLRGKALGRLLPAGYHEGRPDDGSGTYDLWTARHPHVHVPSDTIVAPAVTMARGIALALEGVLASARLPVLPREAGRNRNPVARIQLFLITWVPRRHPTRREAQDDRNGRASGGHC